MFLIKIENNLNSRPDVEEGRNKSKTKNPYTFIIMKGSKFQIFKKKDFNVTIAHNLNKIKSYLHKMKRTIMNVLSASKSAQSTEPLFGMKKLIIKTIFQNFVAKIIQKFKVLLSTLCTGRKSALPSFVLRPLVELQSVLQREKNRMKSEGRPKEKDFY